MTGACTAPVTPSFRRRHGGWTGRNRCLTLRYQKFWIIRIFLNVNLCVVIERFQKKKPKQTIFVSQRTFTPFPVSCSISFFFYRIVLFPSHISDLGEEMTCPLRRHWTVFDVFRNSLWLPASPLCVSVQGYCIWPLRIPGIIEIPQCWQGRREKTKTYLLFYGRRLKISGKMKKNKSYASVIHVRMLMEGCVLHVPIFLGFHEWREERIDVCVLKCLRWALCVCRCGEDSYLSCLSLIFTMRPADCDK